MRKILEEHIVAKMSENNIQELDQLKQSLDDSKEIIIQWFQEKL